MSSDTGEIRHAVERLLATIWASELVDAEPLDDSQRSDWQRRLATVASMRSSC
jgi:hypothetical protein